MQLAPQFTHQTEWAEGNHWADHSRDKSLPVAMRKLVNQNHAVRIKHFGECYRMSVVLGI